MRPWVLFYYGLYALRSFFTYRVLINSGKKFWGESFWILMGGTLWIVMWLTSVGDFAHKESGSWFNRDKWSVFPESALILSEMEQIKDIKGSFNSPGWLQAYLILLHFALLCFNNAKEIVANLSALGGFGLKLCFLTSWKFVATLHCQMRLAFFNNKVYFN